MTEIHGIPIPSAVPVEHEKHTALVRHLEITDAASYERAFMELKINKSLQKEVVETFGRTKKLVNEVLGEVRSQEKRHLEPLKEAESILKDGMIAFEEEAEYINTGDIGGEFTEDGEFLPSAIGSEVGLPSLKGNITRSDRITEVTDFTALVQAVADGSVPLEALKVNAAFLNKMGKKLGPDLNYPGVSVTVKKVKVVRGDL